MQCGLFRGAGIHVVGLLKCNLRIFSPSGRLILIFWEVVKFLFTSLVTEEAWEPDQSVIVDDSLSITMKQARLRRLEAFGSTSTKTVSSVSEPRTKYRLFDDSLGRWMPMWPLNNRRNAGGSANCGTTT